jgi:hypothetical protein
MNKAFVREPEDTGRHYCPRCGTLGEQVGRAVLERYVRPESLGVIGETAYFCPDARCTAAYFDLFERVVPVEHLAVPAYPKDRETATPPCARVSDLRRTTSSRTSPKARRGACATW